MTEKYVYSFNEGKKEMKELLGGKGANLAEMTTLGIPVPPGFTITTEACAYYSENKKHPEGCLDDIKAEIVKLEESMGKKFGDNRDPLLVSVRSGAAISMPGMMDTVLNLGLNDQTVVGVADKGGERFAWDSYRRLLTMFGDVVMGVPHHDFEKLLEEAKLTKGVSYDSELEAEDLKRLVGKYKVLVLEKSGKEFPQDPAEQLKSAVDAVFDSWDNSRAKSYRRL
ncbi:PEP/pyruvate-binding domain-containing protein, partial [Nanoarchaeota archaeon]